MAVLAGVASAVTTLPPRPKPNKEDMEMFRLNPELETLFTNASFTADPTYRKDLAELKGIVASLSGSTRRTNGVKAAAAKPDPHGRHYCVGYAFNPHRTRIFQNRMDCSIEGWTTLVSFCLPKTIKGTKSLPRVEGCVGIAQNPTRSMYFAEKSCDRNGWTHDFSLVTQTTHDLNRLHFLQIWDAIDPHRMLLAGGGDDKTVNGWKYRNFLAAATITWPITPEGIKTLKPSLPTAVKLHKRILPIIFLGAFSIYLLVIAQRALEHLEHDAFHPTQGDVLQRFDDIADVQSVANEFLNRHVPVQLIRTDRVSGGFEGNMVTIRIVVDGIYGGVVSLDETINYGRAWIRQALVRSMLDREPITLFRIFDRNENRYRGYTYGERGGEAEIQ
ncbi:hypothetical protein BGZ83_008617 [Gryganskiella cystojenkinii]|nr:hypothetical protein BGZ83_008617 [Gryganskiella cystojenkinii]